MQRAHERAREQSKTSARRQKTSYDRRVQGAGYDEGDFVWLYNHTRKKGASQKLVSRWEGPYLIIRKLSNVNYRIQDKPRGKMRVVHFDRLKPYTGTPMESWQTEPPRQVTETPPHVDPERLPAGRHHQRSDEETIPYGGVEEDTQTDPIFDIGSIDGDGVTETMPNTGDDSESQSRRNPRRERRLPFRFR